jgi:phage baseplate assembly protein W
MADSQGLAVNLRRVYDPNKDIWPDLKNGRIILRPVRVGVNAKNGKVLIGWDHVLQSIHRIFVTKYHSRVLRRWVGSFMPHILGDSGIERTITRFYWAILTAIDLWEPNYRIQRVRVFRRADGSSLTSPEEFRRGILTTRMDGVYRPRAHLGDNTPERRRSLGLIGRGGGMWDQAGSV